MAHYAFINSNNIVTEVIVGNDEDKTDDLPDGFDSWEAWYADFRGETCKRTSYNTVANAHSDSGTAFRGNYAGIGYTYDEDNDIFITKKPYASWVLNTSEARWQSPIGDAPALSEEEKDTHVYTWNESSGVWDKTAQ